MLTASYNTPSSQWTQGIDRALNAWSNEVVGSPRFNIGFREYDLPNNTMAHTSAKSFVSAGKLADGRTVQIPTAAARFQGYSGPEIDATFTIDPSYPFSFGQLQRGKTSYDDLMKHELTHMFSAVQSPSPGVTPFDLWREKSDHAQGENKYHSDDPNSMFYAYIPQNKALGFTAEDREIIGQSGIPTNGDDLFYLINGANVDGGGGNDTAIWLNPFDQFNANLKNINRLVFGGANPLTSQQQDIYKLYRAGLGRDPDFAGFQYWNGTGKGLLDMANDFYHAPEFAQQAQAPTNRDYIAGLYRNILGRDPEKAGLDYWDSRTDLNRAGLLANIALAPENKINQAAFTL